MKSRDKAEIPVGGMQVEELDKMLADVDKIERFINGQPALNQAEIKEKATAARKLKSLKNGISRLKGTYQGKKASLQKMINDRRAS